MGDLPIQVRNVRKQAGETAVGCLFMPDDPTDHTLIADLIFANSSQWTKFQLDRRGNPGLIKGTIWFFGVAIFQTYRGFSYLARQITGRDKAGWERT
jgi:cellulose synthase (UDP-forming)